MSFFYSYCPRVESTCLNCHLIHQGVVTHLRFLWLCVIDHMMNYWSCHTSVVLVAMRNRSYDELLPQNPSPLALKRKLCPGFWCFCLIPMNKLLLDFFKGKIDPPPPCAPLVPATPVLPFVAL